MEAAVRLPVGCVLEHEELLDQILEFTDRLR
jgi:hypothetical protein